MCAMLISLLCPCHIATELKTQIRLWTRCALIVLAIFALSARSSAATTIYVTTPFEGVSSGGCSLQEAIYSAEFGANIAISQTDPDTTYTTGCEPGTGDGDTIVLKNGEVYTFDKSWDADAHNYMGPTATPIIFKNITIEGNGAMLERTNNGNTENFRLFAVGTVPSSGPLAISVNGNTYSGTGSLTLDNLYVKNFHVQGGNGGATNGGGGLGAGGAIYADEGSLTVDNSTFENNGANGGNGDPCAGCFPNTAGNELLGGGGGGLSGNGGAWNDAGGGGGGARGDGGQGCGIDCQTSSGGGGGGGTVFSGANGTTTGTTGSGGASNGVGGPGGYLCGGNGGDAGNDGHSGECKGGGGGGGGAVVAPDASCFGACVGNGGGGNYGGGGGGGAADGGSGGFGGGGGGAGVGFFELSGGKGGFGGGGGGVQAVGQGSGGPGNGGPFGGHGGFFGGGGGGALGGAIFSSFGSVTVRNSTFYNNYVARGVAGGGDAANGGDSGGAIFAVNGSLIVQNDTIIANQSTGSGGGVTFLTYDFCNSGACLGSHNSFALQNTIIANNGAKECSVLGQGDDLVGVTVSGVGNLITQNDSGAPCPGVVSTSDPQLQTLGLNSPGNTPTMAILTTSPAANAADSGTSLSTDQRGVTRPQNGGYDIGAYEARKPEFFFSPINDIAADVGGSGSTTVTVNSFEYFNSAVALTVLDQPPGVTISLSASSVTPPFNGSASSTLSVKLPATVTAGSYGLLITGTSSSPSLTHSTGTMIVVTPTTGGIKNVISSFLTTGAIDKSGIATSLASKLTTAKTYISAGDSQTAVNVLGALLNEVNAQSGKHISASAAAALVTDTQALETSLGTNLRPDPVLGCVVGNSSNGAIAGVTVSVVNSANAVVATTTTDSTGLYFFPLTRNWTLGAGYTVKVALPKGYKSSTPASQAFTWQANEATLRNFVLN